MKNQHPYYGMRIYEVIFFYFEYHERKKKTRMTDVGEPHENPNIMKNFIFFLL